MTVTIMNDSQKFRAVQRPAEKWVDGSKAGMQAEQNLKSKINGDPVIEKVESTRKTDGRRTGLTHLLGICFEYHRSWFAVISYSTRRG